MDEKDSSAIQKFLEVVGGLLIVGGLTPVMTALISGMDYRIWPAIVVCVIGLMILFCGLFWHRLKPQTDTRFTSTLARIASEPRWWFVVIFGTWLYMAIATTIAGIQRNNEIVALRNDVQSIAKVIERGVLPRHLNKRQQSAMSNFLLQFEPHEFSFKLSARNEEVGEYRVDIEQALLKGGWTRAATNPYIYADDVSEGLSINFMQTMEHVQKGTDFRNPNASMLLQEAFGLAGVRLNGTSGGSGINVTQDSLTIGIGLPRKDSYEFALPDWP